MLSKEVGITKSNCKGRQGRLDAGENVVFPPSCCTRHTMVCTFPLLSEDVAGSVDSSLLTIRPISVLSCSMFSNMLFNSSYHRSVSTCSKNALEAATRSWRRRQLCRQNTSRSVEGLYWHLFRTYERTADCQPFAIRSTGCYMGSPAMHLSPWSGNFYSLSLLSDQYQKVAMVHGSACRYDGTTTSYRTCQLPRILDKDV
jgi:hypothetical protein